MEIPVNQDTSFEDKVEKAIAYVLDEFKSLSFARLTRMNSSESVARVVARRFIDKGYHASERYHRRSHGFGCFWFCTKISKTPLSDESYPMATVTVIG